jgi:hypothetical protein
MMNASLPEPVGEAGFLLAQPVIVGDAAEVHLPHELGVLPDHSCRITYPVNYSTGTGWYVLNNTYYLVLNGLIPYVLYRIFRKIP